MATQREFEPDLESARAVRQFVAEVLSGMLRLDDILLTASELAANVIRHARTTYTVRIATEEGLIRIEVSDASAIIPAIKELTDSKRGLQIINAVSERWGIHGNEAGKTVWVEFPKSV